MVEIPEAETIDEILTKINDRYEEILRHRIYFTLRDMKLRWIFDKTLETVQYCIALSELKKYSITTNMIATLTSTQPQGARDRLHMLGDKHVLTLVRGSKGAQRWILSEAFKRKYYEGEGIYREEEPIEEISPI